MKQNTIILLLAVVGICVCGGIWLCQGKQVQPAETIVSEGMNDSLTQPNPAGAQRMVRFIST